MRTWNGKEAFSQQTLNAALGVAGEAGEVADMVKKLFFHQHPTTSEELMTELGDVLYYVATLAGIWGFPLEAVAQMNIEKLKKRYPDGFSTERSVNRDQ